MAEFCLECLNKITGISFKRWQVRCFKGYDLCEGCGKYKRTVARINLFGRLAEFRSNRKDPDIDVTGFTDDFMADGRLDVSSERESFEE